MDEGAERRIDDEDYETSSFQVEEARKRRYIEYYNSETIPITAQTTEKVVITPPKEDDKKVKTVEPNENKKMYEVGEHSNSDEDFETSSMEDVATSDSNDDGEDVRKKVEEARKRRYIEYYNNETIPITAQQMEIMVITPPKENDKIMKIIEPNENTKMDGGEHRNSDEDYETSSFEDVATSESDGEEAGKMRYIEHCKNETIPFTAREKTEKMVITPQKQHITMNVNPYPCKFCNRSFKSVQGLHDHNRVNHKEMQTKLKKVITPPKDGKLPHCQSYSKLKPIICNLLDSVNQTKCR